LEGDDPKFVDTVNAIENGLKIGSFLRPFLGSKEDGFEKPNNTYIHCALWLIDAYLAIGEELKAKTLFEKVVRRSNHLGLFSEGLDIVNHEMAGNFPYAYTHIAFISTAFKLSGEESGKTPPRVLAID
jgi:GH15 family glucan-1,4-alpha-glucosidase